MPGSIVDLFLESFRIGHHTRPLLNHLVIVALDDKAFRRCLSLHRHCYSLLTEDVDFSKEAYFMTPDYLKMMWRRIDFLRSVLEMGYNFIFTVSLSSVFHLSKHGVFWYLLEITCELISTSWRFRYMIHWVACIWHSGLLLLALQDFVNAWSKRYLCHFIFYIFLVTSIHFIA